jgi:hypothetical protein
MDWLIWVIIAILAGLVIWNFTRRRTSGAMNMDIVMGILANVEDSIRTIEIRLADPEGKYKFQNASWRVFGKKITFLSPELQASLNEGFTMIDEFNRRIDEARRNKSMQTLRDMPVAQLKGPLLKSKEGLQAWIRSQSDKELNKRRGCMGF